jgi:hypothetical protein
MTTMKIVRPRLKRFVAVMSAKLAIPSNQEKGDWRSKPDRALFASLLHELAELSAEMDVGTMGSIVAECADVANMAMMIADNNMPWTAPEGAE